MITAKVKIDLKKQDLSKVAIWSAMSLLSMFNVSINWALNCKDLSSRLHEVLWIIEAKNWMTIKHEYIVKVSGDITSHS